MAARCLVGGCHWVTDEPLRRVAGYAATWHVYEKHPEEWKKQFGDRPPIDPDPRTPQGMVLALVEEALGVAD